MALPPNLLLQEAITVDRLPEKGRMSSLLPSFEGSRSGEGEEKPLEREPEECWLRLMWAILRKKKKKRQQTQMDIGDVLSSVCMTYNTTEHVQSLAGNNLFAPS